LPRKPLWDRAQNPTPYVSQQLGITEAELSDAIHSIKAASNLSGADRVIIYDDGRVEDKRGEQIGNVYDEI
jgi:hypothetical protein